MWLSRQQDRFGDDSQPAEAKAVKTLIIGQAPAKGTVGKLPFSGKSGPKFAELLGVKHEDLWTAFDVTNLLDYFPGSADRGDKFPAIAARTQAAEMLPLLSGRTVVFVGKNVSRAFGFARADFFEWHDGTVGNSKLTAFKYCVVGHPSGCSLYYNVQANVDRAHAFMRMIPR